MNWFIESIKKYNDFSGRARRKEFGCFVLCTFVLFIILFLLESSLGLTFGELGSMGILSTVASIALLLPSLAVYCRRLHDMDMSGWWLLLLFIPLVGFLFLLVMFFRDGTPGANRFGPSPKG